MATRASIFENFQLGVESPTTPGTAVAANIKLTQTKIEARPNVMTEDVSEQGGKGDTDIIAGKEWTTATATGIVNVTDLPYLLAATVARPVVTGTVSEYAINQYGPDDRLTFTAEMGGSEGRARIPGMQGKAFEIKLSEDKAPTYSFDLYGKLWDDTLSALTASPTRLVTSPIGPKGVSVYIADSLAGLDNAASKLDKGLLLDASFKIDSTTDTVFGIEDVDSYSSVVDDKPVITLSIAVEAKSRANDYMANLRAEKQMYARIRMVGRTFSSTQSKIEIDFPFQFKDPDAGDVRKVFTRKYVCRANFDGVGTGKLGTMCRIRITQAALITAQTNSIKDTDGVQQGVQQDQQGT